MLPKLIRYFLLPIIVLTSFLISPSVFAAETKERVVNASGNGSVYIPQTIATLQISISKTGKNPKDIQAEVRGEAEQLVKKLKAAKPLSFETISAAVNPVMSYANNTSKVTGYNAVYTVQTTSPIPEAGYLIDIAMDNGATEVSGPTLSVSDRERDNAEVEAIKLATLEAKRSADAALTALGLKSMVIKQITIQNTTTPTQQSVRYKALSLVDQSSPPVTNIESGKQQVSASVNLIVGY